MSTLKKRQHYVWREYLRNWAEDEQIWCYLKSEDKVIRTNIMNVAQKKYFYKLTVLNELEFKILETFIQRSPEGLREGQSFILDCFKAFKVLKEKSSSANQDKLKELEINTLENSHTYIERLGNELLNMTSFEDFQRMNDYKIRHKSITYIIFQYFRTSFMKNSIKKVFKNDPFPASEIWSVLSYFLSENIAMNIIANDKLGIIFIENKSLKNFITTDQPALNLKANELDENGNVKELDLYYPLSPKFAVRINIRNNSGMLLKYSKAEIDTVKWLNNKMKGYYENNIFATLQEELNSNYP